MPFSMGFCFVVYLHVLRSLHATSPSEELLQLLHACSRIVRTAAAQVCVLSQDANHDQLRTLPLPSLFA